MLVQRFHHFDQLLPLESAWRRLSNCSPFSDWDWCRHWWPAYSAGRELYVLAVFDSLEQGNVLAIAPWFKESSPTKGARVKFLGSGQVCSDYVQILCEPQNQTWVSEQLAFWLHEADERPGDAWDFLSFDGLRQGDVLLTQLRRAMVSLGHAHHDDIALDCWRLEPGDSWDEYCSRLASRNRRRKLRELKTRYIDRGRTRYRRACTSEEFTSFYSGFVELHQRRRKSLNEPGCFSEPDFAEFLEAAARSLFELGHLRLMRLEVDGMEAAYSLGIENTNVHYIYQTGMNPDLVKDNPGWLLNIHHILDGIEHRTQAIDFLRGNEPYKERLGAKRIPMSKFRIVSRKPNAWILDKAWQLRSEVKRTLPRLSGWLPSAHVPSVEA